MRDFLYDLATDPFETMAPVINPLLAGLTMGGTALVVVGLALYGAQEWIGFPESAVGPVLGVVFGIAFALAARYVWAEERAERARERKLRAPQQWTWDEDEES